MRWTLIIEKKNPVSVHDIALHKWSNIFPIIVFGLFEVV
jgi:hypothetical protein